VIGATDFSGKRVPGVAKATLDARAEWRYGTTGVVALSARHNGRVIANDANTASSPSYTVTDATVQLSLFHVRSAFVRVTAGVSNIADVAYNTAVAINALGTRYYEPGPGRSLYAGVSLGLNGGRRAGR
jgi:iron complex outermembrane recepter protein